MKTPRILATTIASLLLASPLFAATSTWDGGGADNNISTALNWVANAAPVSDLVNTDLIFAGAVRLTPTFSAVFSAHSVTFNNTAGAFSFSGQVLTIGAGGIVNNDTQTQTFNNTIFVGVASTSFNAASGPLTFATSVTLLGGIPVSLDGANAFSFENILNSGTVTKTGAGVMSYAPTVPQSIDLVINAGTVNTVADGSPDNFTSLASIAVNGTSILNINENLNIIGQLTRASGADINIASGKTLTASFGGDITIIGTYAPSSGSITTVTGAGSTFSMSNTFTLASSAVLNVQDGGLFTSSIGIFLLNATGVLNIDGGTVNITGTLTKNPGSTLNFTAGELGLLGTNNFTVGTAGLLGQSLTLAADRQLTIGGTTTVDAFRTLTLDGGTLSTGALVNNGSIAFNKGTLSITGAGGLNVGTGGLGASVTLGAGANLAVTNTTTVNSGATLRTDGGSFSGAALTNNGTIDHRAGTFGFTGTLTNNSGGRVFIADTMSAAGASTNNGTITLQNGTGQISGAGTLSNNALVTGDGTISAPVTNASAGQIRAEAGKTLYFTGAFAANAGTLSLEGGTLDFSTAITNSATGFISGRGALRTAGLTNNGVMAFSGGNADIHGDVTNAAGARIVTSGGATATFFDDVVHNGLEIRTSAGGASVFFGAVSGAGPFTGTGTVYFEGDLRPGNSPASVRYGGDVAFGGAATLTLEIGGLLAGSQYDRLDVAGTLFEDGVLDVSLYGGFTPHFGDRFDLFDAGAIAGSFDAVNLPELTGGLAWDTTQLQSTGQLGVVPEPGTGALLASALGFLGIRRGGIRGARASRVLVSASRRNELPGAPDLENPSAIRALPKVREGGTPSPARLAHGPASACPVRRRLGETRALPGTARAARSTSIAQLA